MLPHHQALPPTPASRLRRGRLRFASTIGLVFVAVLVTAAVVPSVRASLSPAGTPPSTFGSPGPANAALQSGPQVAVTSPTFWGVVAQTAASRGITNDPAIGAFLNATPFQVFSYSPQADQCNITTETFYTGAGGSIHPCGYNLTEFKSWCDARGSTCTSIVTLPGENNDSSEDAYVASWIVNTVGFQPTYWAVGNEPSLWTHYGEPWSQWTSKDANRATPIAYAVDVRNAIHAVQKVDPKGHFLGIEADCQCSPAWFAAVGAVDGGLIAGIAYHTYPSQTGTTNDTLQELFEPLVDKNITTSYALVRSDFSQACSRCATLPIFVTEYNSGPGWAPSQWAGKFPDAVFLAASVTQALRANLTAFDVYYLQSDQATDGWGMINNANLLGPEGILYKAILDHLASGRVLGVRVSTTVGNVWAVETVDGKQSSLLVVNANLSRGIDLALGSVVAPAPLSISTSYQWAPALPVPLVTPTALLPNSFVVPVEGILLIDWTT
jgi:hypothetical protein